MHNPTPPTYTVDELIEMDDEQFDEIVGENLRATARYRGPFQDPKVVQRTLLALIEKLWFVDAQIQRNAEDPNYPIERYERALSFRRQLLMAIDISERRAAFSVPSARGAAEWRRTLNEVCDEIEGGPEDEVLDIIDIPFAEGLSLRSWLEIRRIKDPSRIPSTKEVAA